MAFFVIDENHNLIEAYDKEGVLAVLAQAIADGSLSGITADSGFISKIKCCVSGQTNRIAFVTQAKYNELEKSGNLENGVYYYITDDTTAEDIEKTLTELVNFKNNVKNGTETVGMASGLKLAKGYKYYSGMNGTGEIKGTNDIVDGLYNVTILYDKHDGSRAITTNVLICVENVNFQANKVVLDALVDGKDVALSCVYGSISKCFTLDDANGKFPNSAYYSIYSVSLVAKY